MVHDISYITNDYLHHKNSLHYSLSEINKDKNKNFKNQLSCLKSKYLKKYKFETHRHTHKCTYINKLVYLIFFITNVTDIFVQILYLVEERDCFEPKYMDVPKALSDMFKSFIAAIYLDSGRDLNFVWSMIWKLMGNEISKF